MGDGDNCRVRVNWTQLDTDVTAVCVQTCHDNILPREKMTDMTKKSEYTLRGSFFGKAVIFKVTVAFPLVDFRVTITLTLTLTRYVHSGHLEEGTLHKSDVEVDTTSGAFTAQFYGIFRCHQANKCMNERPQPTRLTYVTRRLANLKDINWPWISQHRIDTGSLDLQGLRKNGAKPRSTSISRFC